MGRMCLATWPGPALGTPSPPALGHGTPVVAVAQRRRRSWRSGDGGCWRRNNFGGQRSALEGPIASHGSGDVLGTVD
jgi:hypothetical protein